MVSATTPAHTSHTQPYTHAKIHADRFTSPAAAEALLTTKLRQLCVPAAEHPSPEIPPILAPLCTHAHTTKTPSYSILSYNSSYLAVVSPTQEQAGHQDAHVDGCQVSQVGLLTNQQQHRLDKPPQQRNGDADGPADGPGAVQHLTQHCIISSPKGLQGRQQEEWTEETAAACIQHVEASSSSSWLWFESAEQAVLHGVGRTGSGPPLQQLLPCLLPWVYRVQGVCQHTLPHTSQGSTNNNNTPTKCVCTPLSLSLTSTYLPTKRIHS